VAYESTYSHPGKQGCVQYHDGHCCTDIDIHYLLSDDWNVGVDMLCWQAEARERRAQRAAQPPLDARAVLYGRPLLEHIARGCYAACIESHDAPSEDQQYDCIKQVHADWLLTPREDLRGQTPREVMYAKKEFIERDMNSRCDQWSHLDECPPILDRGSNAYRYAGFGTHEMIQYYYLARELLASCTESALSRRDSARSQFLGVQDFLKDEIPLLEKMGETWLDTPDPECHFRTPRSIIDNERRRKPEAGSGKDAMIDPDCPCCQMMADMPGPFFWHLDGCNMDHEFAFAIFYETREEWEEEERSWEEFDRKYKTREEERDRLGVIRPSDDCWDAQSVWQRSFVAKDTPGTPLPLRLFAVGTLLSELTVDIKDAGGERALIDDLSRDFGNLREVLQSDDKSLAQSLAGPVLDRFSDTLGQVSAVHEDLRPKCEDLQQRLGRFLEPPSENSEEADDWLSDDDIPF
jgi:hypothetical protein